MNTEGVRRGVGYLCAAAACGLLFLLAGDSPISPLFGVGFVVTALGGLFEIASGINLTARSDDPPKD